VLLSIGVLVRLEAKLELFAKRVDEARGVEVDGIMLEDREENGGMHVPLPVGV
jgi:hypothetical protein